MAYGYPNISFIGYPVAVPCAGHAGFGLRELCRLDSEAVFSHLRDLDPADRRMRFCASLNDAGLERHVAGIWQRRSVVIAAHDGPLWSGPLHRAGPIRGLVELAIDGREAELGISVCATLRQRGLGTYMVQAAAAVLLPRGVTSIRAYTLPGNASFLTLARRAGATIEAGLDEIETTFDVADLNRAYLRRRAAEAFAKAG